LEKHVLSKSTFLRSVQCQKSLYLYKNFIQLRDAQSAEQTAIFSRGNRVGKMAQQLFPNGVDATPTKTYDYRAAVSNTLRYIEQGAEVIYEAAFQAQGVLAIMDILVKKENLWYAYEVKSSTKISQTYLMDAALQYWVIQQSGVALQDISIVTINNQYILEKKLEVAKLFTISSVKEDVVKKQAFVQQKMDEAKQTISNARMPDVAIGTHCFSPYTCDFKGNCFKNIPSNSVFDISGISKEEQFNLYNNGITTLDALPNNIELAGITKMYLSSIRQNSIIINKEKIAAFLNQISYPLYFIDFEIFMPAVPLFKGTKPYQHIPFQFSVIYKQSSDALELHAEFLSEQSVDPRKPFVEAFLKSTKNVGTILAYDTLMEKGILNSLKNDFPEYADDLQERINRLKDMSEPFQQKWFYHHAMKNSFSIKNMVDVLVPELSYKNLGIQTGSVAMIAFENLQTETDIFKISETRQNLLEYCKQDTLAMLYLFQILVTESNK
jgi:Domain of unknown function(DUF2779)